jgi:hypothetical protein
MASTAGGVPQARIKRVLAEIIGTLRALHEQGRVSGSISIQSIGLDDAGHAHLSPAAKAPETGYAPPELYDVELQWPRGPWTDIYGLSAVAYSLIAGKRPPAAVERMALDVYLPLAERGLSGYEVAFLQAIDSGLSLDPQARPQSLDQFSQRLGLKLSASTAPVREDTPMGASWMRAQRLSWRAWKPAIVTAAVLATGAALYWWGRASNPDSHFIAAIEPRLAKSVEEIDFDRLPPTAAVRSTAPSMASGAADEPLAAVTSPPVAAPVVATAVVAATPIAAARIAAVPIAAMPIAAAPVAPPARMVIATVAPTATAMAHPSRAEALDSVAVRLDIQPWGEIWADGVRHGASPPLKELQLEPGQHTIVVRNADLPPYQATLTVRPGHPTTLSHNFD